MVTYRGLNLSLKNRLAAPVSVLCYPSKSDVSFIDVVMTLGQILVAESSPSTIGSYDLTLLRSAEFITHTIPMIFVKGGATECM